MTEKPAFEDKTIWEKYCFSCSCRPGTANNQGGWEPSGPQKQSPWLAANDQIPCFSQSHLRKWPLHAPSPSSWSNFATDMNHECHFPAASFVYPWKLLLTNFAFNEQIQSELLVVGRYPCAYVCVQIFLRCIPLLSTPEALFILLLQWDLGPVKRRPSYSPRIRKCVLILNMMANQDLFFKKDIMPYFDVFGFLNFPFS